MPFQCKLCETEWVYTTHVCADCRKIKNLMNIYGKPQVIQVLENVLVRNTAGILNKETDLLKKGLVKIKEETKEEIKKEPEVEQIKVIETRSKRPK